MLPGVAAYMQVNERATDCLLSPSHFTRGCKPEVRAKAHRVGRNTDDHILIGSCSPFA